MRKGVDEMVVVMPLPVKAEARLNGMVVEALGLAEAAGTIIKGVEDIVVVTPVTVEARDKGIVVNTGLAGAGLGSSIEFIICPIGGVVAGAEGF